MGKRGRPPKVRRHSEPVFVATDRGEVLPWNILNRFALKSAGVSPSRVLPIDRFGAEYTEKGLVAPLYDLETLIALLEVNTFHYRCCRVKATDTVGGGFKLQSKTEQDIPKDINDFFFNNRYLKKPLQFILTDIQMDFEALGIMCFEVVREGYHPDGAPQFITHIPAHTVRPHYSGNRFLQKRGIKTVWYKRWGYEKDVHKNTGEEFELGSLAIDDRASEIVWDLEYSGRSDFYGMPQIIPALGAVEGMVALRDYNINFFRNHGIPSYAIYITGDYDLGELVRYKKENNGTGILGEVYDPDNPNMSRDCFEYKIVNQVKEKLSSVTENPHSPLILAVPGATPESRVNLEFKPLNVEVKDASFRLYRKDARDEIIEAHGVPPYRIGVAETGSLGGSTAVESSKIYRDSVIMPRKERLGSLITATIIREGYKNPYIDFVFNPLDIEEETKDKEIAEFLFRSAAITPNELRKHFGYMFGLSQVSDWPELDMFYLNGQPIRPLGNSNTDMLTAIRNLQETIIRTANNEAD